jgi:DNA repair photolyase
MNRVKAGYVDIVNPFNPRQKRRVELNPESVDCLVFWTRNPLPLSKHLDDLDERGFRYIFLCTITGYPRELELNLPSVETAVETFKKLSAKIGPERAIWRYDPIVLSSVTDEKYHRRNFERIAGELSGYTKRAIISFVDVYKKIRQRLARLYDKNEIEMPETQKEVAVRLTSELRRIAGSCSMNIQSCAEEFDLTPAGITPGSCIDTALINKIFGLDLAHQKDPGQRERCLCSKSVDIGAYNTCGYRCVYCYANASFEAADRNRKMINNSEPSLFVGNMLNNQGRIYAGV